MLNCFSMHCIRICIYLYMQGDDIKLKMNWVVLDVIQSPLERRHRHTAEYESTRVRSRLLSDINTSRRVLFVLHDSIAIFIYYRKTFQMFQPLVVVERPQNKLIPVITDVVPQPESLLLLLLLFFIFFFSSSSSVSPEDKEKMQLFMLLRTRKAQTLVTWKKVKQTWCCCLFVFFLLACVHVNLEKWGV